jgi:dephospho-CoA kinase
MLKIGLTGGIGSGKTTVAKIFEILGIPVYYSDDAAKRIMQEDQSLRAELLMAFGERTFENGILNRAYLAEIVFGNPEQLAVLNKLVHPRTIKDCDNWMEKQTTSYAIKEAALIFETDVWRNLDVVIGVSAPYDFRLKRAMQRDQISKETIESRMGKQMNEEEKMKRCDFIIYNDERLLLIPQVIDIHKKLMKGALKNL